MNATLNPGPLSRTFAPKVGVPLSPMTSLQLGGNAAFFAEAHTETDVFEAVAWAKAKGVPLFVLGGGTNVVIADDGFDGLVLAMAITGVQCSAQGPSIDVTAAAGEPWERFVTQATLQGWAGVECLAGIPGQVGSTPIQNVGAYGQDVSETITSVRVFDRASCVAQRLPAADLQFSYRHSLFRRQLDRFIVLAVSFRLRAGAPPSLRYTELQKAMAAVEAPSLVDVQTKVLELRRRKSMVLDVTDPNTRSVGSFFTNPLVDEATRAHVVIAAGPSQTVPQWPQPDGRTKLSAAWLIEGAGFCRGHRTGAVGISSAHALALIHHGSGRTADLLSLARQVRQAVQDKFGVTLQPEPILIGNAQW